MNVNEDENKEMFPPLLREQVFTDHGAADWLRTLNVRNPLSAWLLVTGSLGSIAAFAIACTLVSHQQVSWYAASVVPSTYVCRVGGLECRVYVRILEPTAEDYESFSAGAALHIGESRTSLGRSHVIAVRSGDVGSKPVLLISWPTQLAPPEQDLLLGAVRSQSLAEWVLGRKKTLARSGEPK